MTRKSEWEGAAAERVRCVQSRHGGPPNSLPTTCPSNQINFTFTIADDTLLLGLAREVAVCGCRESCQPREGRA
jgi:hypothetical protein